MKVITSLQSLSEYIEQQKRESKKIAFVPTMGNLHQGHLDLVQRAHELASLVIVSIFVNPLQFEAGGDLSNYPKTLEADIEKLQQAGVDMLFAPDVREIYGDDLSTITQVIVPGISSLWCGASRTGHFEGVTTIVNKLFNLVQPDIAVFGEKDFQQLTIIRMMVRDLSIPVEIESVATSREADGLAMSSRNGYLTKNEREVAAKLHETLLNVQKNVVSEDHPDFQKITEQATKSLNQNGFKTDYLSICRQSDLQPAGPEDSNLVILAAAHLGKARLIDNLVLDNQPAEQLE